MLVIIPLGHGSNHNDWELRYALRSLEKNLQQDIELFVLCEQKPDWLKAETFSISRYYPDKVLSYFGGERHYENYFDVLNKLRFVSENFNEDFLWAYDDVLLVSALNEIQLTAYVGTERGFIKRRRTKWGRTINKALEITDGGYVFETHIPRVMNPEKWREIFENYPIEDYPVPYAPSTLYYNYYSIKPNLILTENNIKAGFYGQKKDFDSFYSDTEEQITAAIMDKIWVSYNDRGMTESFIDYFEQMFPNKSRFE